MKMSKVEIHDISGRHSITAAVPYGREIQIVRELVKLRGELIELIEKDESNKKLGLKVQAELN